MSFNVFLMKKVYGFYTSLLLRYSNSSTKPALSSTIMSQQISRRLRVRYQQLKNIKVLS